MSAATLRELCQGMLEALDSPALYCEFDAPDELVAMAQEIGVQAQLLADGIGGAL